MHDVTGNVCTCPYMELQDSTVKITGGKAQIEITGPASGESCGNDLPGKARLKIPGKIVESLVALITREDAIAHATALATMSDRESLFLVWENNASQAVTILNRNARSNNESWTNHRFTKAIVANFGCTWPERNRQESGYIEFCRKEHIAIPTTTNAMSRKRNLVCTVQGCETSALRQNNGKFCAACLEIETNRKSQHCAKSLSTNSIPVPIDAPASTRQQGSNGQLYCVVQKLLEIHALNI